MDTRSPLLSGDLRVVVPLLTLVSGGMGGSETYARELIRHLGARPGLQVSVVARGESAVVAEGTQSVVRQLPGGKGSIGRAITQTAAELDISARRSMASAHLVHYPLSVTTPPPPSRMPWVQTLLDVQHHDLPTLFSRAELAYRRVRYDRPARRADAVITISEFSRQRIITTLGVPAERVHVAHLGVDTSEFSPSHAAREDFVLYPARGWPHKNHRRLVAAMSVVREQHPGLRLVLTGGGLGALPELPRWVEVRGQVTRHELLELYRRARCLAFPSLYEGFGLPPLEAMSSGCPVAASNVGALPEVCGEAAVLFDPTEARSIAAGILAALRRGRELSERGVMQSARFSWEACADAHERVYREVLARTEG